MPELPPVIILSGGLGTRLQELDPHCPKAMAPVNGEPFIAHQLRLLAGKGITKAIICTGHLGEQIIDFVGKGEKFHIAVSYSPDGKTPLGTGGAVHKALPVVADHFYVMYGDSYLDISFASVFEAYSQSNCPGLMTVFKKTQGKCNTQFSDGKILDYNKENQSSRMHHIDFGLLVFNKKAFLELPEGESFDLALVFRHLIDRNELAGYEMFTPYFEIGTPQGLDRLQKHLVDHHS